MEYTLKLSGDHINTVLRHLDLGTHKDVRSTMDLIISQVNEQEKAKLIPLDDAAGLTD